MPRWLNLIRQAAIQRQGIGDQALGVGAYGGGRHGIQMAEYAKGSDMNRALLQGQLLQQGFQQGQGARARRLSSSTRLGNLPTSDGSSSTRITNKLN